MSLLKTADSAPTTTTTAPSKAGGERGRSASLSVTQG